MGVKGFVEGGIASVVAGTTTHPLDLIKVRMHLQGEASLRPTPALNSVYSGTAFHIPSRLGPVSLAVNLVQTEGVAALYSGVSATVLRHSLYSTTGMGLYALLKQRWTDPDSATMPLHRKIAAGLIAGGIGAAVGSPADVAMIRMQADGRLPAAQRRNYAGVVDAIRSMARREGVGSLWRGSSLTVKRAMIVTASQLASYDQIKEKMVERGAAADGMGTHVAASGAAGLVAALASNPVDVIKTRVMNMEAGTAAPYRGAVDCAVKTVRAEGVVALYKGFVPTISRQGPFTVVMFVTLEQIRKVLKDF